MEPNTIVQWVVFLVVGGVIGWLAGIITIGRGFGIVGDIAVGVVGALLGGWIARSIGLSAGGSVVGVFLVALAGAMILVGLTRFVTRAV